MSSVDVEKLKSIAHQMRYDAIKMAFSCGSRGAHISGSLSCIEIYTALYCAVLNLSKEDWDNRDRFIAGKEHARLAEYPAMKAAGLITDEEMLLFEADDSTLAGHPCCIKKGLEYSSCSLGMALSIAVGKALAAKMADKKYKVFCLLGDGECDEGVVWEAIMTAAKYKLSNLTLIIDRNNMSVDGCTEDVMPLGDMRKKLEEFGWYSISVDGHCFPELITALQTEHTEKPLAVIANTIKGKGISFIENDKRWHQAVLNDEDYSKALKCLKVGSD